MLIGDERQDTNPVLNLNDNFASVYGIYIITGYDPLMDTTPEFSCRAGFLHKQNACTPVRSMGCAG